MNKTFREQVIDDIFRFSKSERPFDLIEQKYQSINKEILRKELIQVGIMPEVFEHDSTEEKLWSKFSDIVLAKSLNYLDINSEVIRTRRNSADVFSRTRTYTMVSDAKCFRLSRTAKNQKDFKIKALDDWRRENTYALLVVPLSQYPIDRSQIYQQAISHKVVLLSYLHLQFLLNFDINNSLKELWEISDYVLNNYKPSEQSRGIIYWHSVDNLISKITGRTIDFLNKYKQLEIQVTKEVGQEGISYWESKIAEFKKLNREEAIQLLIKAEKIEQKIETIKRSIERISLV